MCFSESTCIEGVCVTLEDDADKLPSIPEHKQAGKGKDKSYGMYGSGGMYGTNGMGGVYGKNNGVHGARVLSEGKGMGGAYGANGMGGVYGMNGMGSYLGSGLE